MDSIQVQHTQKLKKNSGPARVRVPYIKNNVLGLFTRWLSGELCGLPRDAHPSQPSSQVTRPRNWSVHTSRIPEKVDYDKPDDPSVAFPLQSVSSRQPILEIDYQVIDERLRCNEVCCQMKEG